MSRKVKDWSEVIVDLIDEDGETIEVISGETPLDAERDALAELEAGECVALGMERETSWSKGIQQWMTHETLKVWGDREALLKGGWINADGSLRHRTGEVASMRWYVSAAAVKEYQSIAGYPVQSEGPIWNRAERELADLCELAKLVEGAKTYADHEIYRCKATIKGRRARMELEVSHQRRAEGDLPQLVRVRLKGYVS